MPCGRSWKAANHMVEFRPCERHSVADISQIASKQAPVRHITSLMKVEAEGQGIELMPDYGGNVLYRSWHWWLRASICNSWSMKALTIKQPWAQLIITGAK